MEKDNFNALADAIVLQAVQDFWTSAKKLQKKPDDPEAVRCAYDVRRFFRSRWFGALTGADGTVILQRLEAEPERARGLTHMYSRENPTNKRRRKQGG